MPEILFDGFGNFAQVIVNAPLLYCAVILFVRISGKRSTAQMNNFDWIVTVAMGSLVASGLIIDDVALAEAVFAILALMLLQYAFTWGAWHSPRIESLIKATPQVLLSDGILLRDGMRRERVTDGEIMAALRESGLDRMEDARWVILESDASLSVIPKSDAMPEPTALANVRGTAAARQ